MNFSFGPTFLVINKWQSRRSCESIQRLVQNYDTALSQNFIIIFICIIVIDVFDKLSEEWIQLCSKCVASGAVSLRGIEVYLLMLLRISIITISCRRSLCLYPIAPSTIDSKEPLHVFLFFSFMAEHQKSIRLFERM